MKSITIHNLDDQTSELIEQKARETGLSLNKTIKKLLRKALGISEEQISGKQEFAEFLGVWDDNEYEAFTQATEELERINEEDWK